ncbi:MAG: hypothetical protein ACLSAH_18895 [Bilophila wadsworthia]
MGRLVLLIMAGVLCFMLQTQDLLTLENQGRFCSSPRFCGAAHPSVI